MDFITGSSKSSWQPVVTTDTTTSSYWLNWRVLICAICLVSSLVFTFFLILKYEGPRDSRNRSRETEEGKEHAGLVYEDELWKPSLRGIHPAWLLGYRLVVFFVLLIMLCLNVAVDGGSIFDYYTQWTFTLITLYFGVGAVISLQGCYKYQSKVGSNGMGNLERDAERGSHGFSLPAANPNMAISARNLSKIEIGNDRQVAGLCGYIFQVMFQMSAGAVMLTDTIFWFIIVPLLAIKDYELSFLVINMHSINAVFLVGEAAFNCMRFPWFRIAYFFLWTTVYVIFQWILHSLSATWWPYPFLDLSDSFSPLWYSTVALLHIPCYGVFALIMKLKHLTYLRLFPQSYESVS
ncbi:hypothetical protein DCAR_0730023 [Daucus carota subsp. sativus]|uniref:Transmembrane protein n=1 Tax=Daucus carota subsp. sativus TaxID=79200 RepID=A0A164UM66_DAUCS|nr:hypothetical protein DCAR_0730023 [Daucus carota subsp. sativus]